MIATPKKEMAPTRCGVGAVRRRNLSRHPPANRSSHPKEACAKERQRAGLRNLSADFLRNDIALQSSRGVVVFRTDVSPGQIREQGAAVCQSKVPR